MRFFKLVRGHLVVIVGASTSGNDGNGTGNGNGNDEEKGKIKMKMMIWRGHFLSTYKKYGCLQRLDITNCCCLSLSGR